MRSVEGNTIRSTASDEPNFRLESAPSGRIYELAAAPSLPQPRADSGLLSQFLQRMELVTDRPAPRIAVKAKGRILFLELTEIAAVQAEGNYVSLRHRLNQYLLRESLSSMAQKLRPYGFIRIHRSVIVNIPAVEEIQALSTGEYRLRIRDGNEYLVTRTYKENLRDLAHVWIGSDRLCG